MKYDAELRNAYYDNQMLYGIIYNDKKKRFEDGTPIHTSRIVKRLPDNLYQTLNSVYKVTFIEDGSKDKAEKRSPSEDWHWDVV
jgi:hypothetical protein